MNGLLLPAVTVADKILDDCGAVGPAQNVLLLFEEKLLTDEGTEFLHVARLEGGAREFKLDFPKTILWGNQTQAYLAV